MTELITALWNNDVMSTILNPEAILFSNPIAHASSCTADCAASAAWQKSQ